MRTWFRPLLDPAASGGAGGAPAAGAGAGAPAPGGGNTPGASGNTQPAAASATGSAKPDSAAAAKPSSESKTFRVKVDGQEVTMSEAELLQSASMGKAAFNRMREAAEAKRAMEGFFEQLRADPLRALDNPALGLTGDQKRALIEKYYQKNYIEADKLTPEQKLLREKDQELEKYRQKEQADQEALKTRQQKVLEEQWRGNYQKQIISALETGGLPKTPHTVARMAFYMSQAAEAGFDAPMETIVEKVREDYQTAIHGLTLSATPEVLLKLLGPDIAKRIRAYDLEQWKARRAKKNVPAPEIKEERGTTSKKDERLSYSDVLKKFGS